MTNQQQELIDTLAGRKIEASFNGRFLNGVQTIKKTSGKTQKQRFSVMFDDAATLEGPAVVWNSLSGTYAEACARDCFFEALRIGQGDDAALRFANECRATGIRIGASQAWIDAHQDRLVAVEV